MIWLLLAVHFSYWNGVPSQTVVAEYSNKSDCEQKAAILKERKQTNTDYICGEKP